MAKLSIVAALTLACAACGSQGSPPGNDARRFSGGWDGPNDASTAVLLLRDDLEGTLHDLKLAGGRLAYSFAYDVEGVLGGDGRSIDLSLVCAQAATAEPAVRDDPSAWSAVDCAGWELELACELVGDCEANGCNLICDVTYFGDGYATMAIPLSRVEDHFSTWQRV